MRRRAGPGGPRAAGPAGLALALLLLGGLPAAAPQFATDALLADALGPLYYGRKRGPEECETNTAARVSLTPDQYLEIPKRRTFGTVYVSMINATDMQIVPPVSLETGEVLEEVMWFDEEIRVSWSVPRAPRGSKAQGDTVMLLYNGTINQTVNNFTWTYTEDDRRLGPGTWNETILNASFSIVPHVYDHDNVTGVTFEEPYLIPDNVTALNVNRTDDLFFTLAEVDRITAFFQPDRPGFYELEAVLEDNCNATTVALANVTVACETAPKAKIEGAPRGVIVKFQGKDGYAMQYADEQHPEGWFPAFRLNATGTEALDRNNQYEVLEEGGNSTIYNYTVWDDTPVWDVPFHPKDGILYEWLLLQAPKGSAVQHKTTNDTLPTQYTKDGDRIVSAVAPRGGRVPEILELNSPNTTFLPDVVGIYAFGLNASDVCSKAEQTLAVAFTCNKPPVVEVAHRNIDHDRCLPGVTLSATPSFDEDQDIMYYTWTPVQGTIDEEGTLGAVGGHPNASEGIFLTNTDEVETYYLADTTGFWNFNLEVSDGCLARAFPFKVEVEWDKECSAMSRNMTVMITFALLLYGAFWLFWKLSVERYFWAPFHPLDPNCIKYDLKRMYELEEFLKNMRYKKLMGSAAYLEHQAKAAEASRLKNAATMARLKGDEFAMIAANAAEAFADERMETFKVDLHHEWALLPITVVVWRAILIFSIAVEFVQLWLLLFLSNVRWPIMVTDLLPQFNLSFGPRHTYTVCRLLQVYLFGSVLLSLATQQEGTRLRRGFAWTAAAPGRAAARWARLRALKAEKYRENPRRPGRLKAPEPAFLDPKRDPKRGRRKIGLVQRAVQGVQKRICTVVLFNNFFLCEFMFVPILHNSIEMLTCTYYDHIHPYPHLAKDESFRCWRGEHMALVIWAGLSVAVLLPFTLAFALDSAQAVDLRLREIPQFAIARHSIKYLAVCFSVFFGTAERTRVAPLGPYGVPNPELRDGSGYAVPTTLHVGNDVLHLFPLLGFFAALLYLNVRLQPLRGRARLLNDMRSVAYGMLLYASLLALDVTVGGSAALTVSRPGTVYRGVELEGTDWSNGKLTSMFAGLLPIGLLALLLGDYRAKEINVPDIPMDQINSRIDLLLYSQSVQVLILALCDGTEARDSEEDDETQQIERWLDNLEEDMENQILVWVKLLQVSLVGGSVSQNLKVAALAVLKRAAEDEDGVYFMAKCEAGAVVRRMLGDPNPKVKVAACKTVARLTESADSMTLLLNSDRGNWKVTQGIWDGEQKERVDWLSRLVIGPILVGPVYGAYLGLAYKYLRVGGAFGMNNWVMCRWIRSECNMMQNLIECAMHQDNFVVNEALNTLMEIVEASSAAGTLDLWEARSALSVVSQDSVGLGKKEGEIGVNPLEVVLDPKFRTVETTVESLASVDRGIRSTAQSLFNLLAENDNMGAVSGEMMALLTSPYLHVRLRTLQTAIQVYTMRLSDLQTPDEAPLELPVVAQLLEVAFLQQVGELILDPEGFDVREAACMASKSAWTVILYGSRGADERDAKKAAFFDSGILDNLVELSKAQEEVGTELATVILADLLQSDAKMRRQIMRVEKSYENMSDIQRQNVLVEIRERKEARERRAERERELAAQKTPRSEGTSRDSDSGSGYTTPRTAPTTPGSDVDADLSSPEKWSAYADQSARKAKRDLTEDAGRLAGELFKDTFAAPPPAKPEAHPLDRRMTMSRADLAVEGPSGIFGGELTNQDPGRIRRKPKAAAERPPADGGRVPWQERVARHIVAGGSGANAHLPRGEHERAASRKREFSASQVRIARKNREARRRG